MSEQFDRDKWLHELAREDAKRAHDKSDSFHEYVNKATMDSGQLALRMLMLINGGAVVALLTFVEKLDKPQRQALGDTLVWFASGVALAVAGVALAYFTNYFMVAIESSKERRWEHPYLVDGPNTKLFVRLNFWFHIATVVAGLLSLLAFMFGVFEVRDALHLINGHAT